MALYFIGAGPIISLTDDSKAARACAAFYPVSRDYVLSELSWSFAVHRQDLGILSGTNNTEYSYMYSLPEDPYCLLPLAIVDYPEQPWLVEDRVFYTNLDAVMLRYVAQVTNVRQFEAKFVKALAYRIAADISFQLRGADGKNQEMEAFYQREILKAEAFNKKGRETPYVRPKSWVEARHE